MAFSDIEIIGMCNDYTDETVLGGGAIKGKNCTIKSITQITGGHRVTFEWTLDDGTVQTQSMDVMDGTGSGSGAEIVGAVPELSYDPVSITLTSGYYVNRSNGNLVEYANCSYAELAVAAGDRYRIVAAHQTNVTPCAFYDAEGHHLGSVPNYNVKVLTSEAVDVTVPEDAVLMRCSGYVNGGQVLKIYKTTETGKVIIPPTNDVLYGKKWAACGDSFTFGSMTGYTDKDGHTGELSDAFDDVQGLWKGYAYWIKNRTGMDLTLLAMGGNDFTNISGATRPFSVSTSNINYTQIPADADYVTIAFGLNESDMTQQQIGSKTDTTNETLWGAYNVVLTSILTANPLAKIGIIITDAWITQTYHDALIEIAKYWGVPYLDLRDGVQVSMLIGGRLSDHSTAAATLKTNAMAINGTTNEHPNPLGHKYRSTIIEAFLRTL